MPPKILFDASTLCVGGGVQFAGDLARRAVEDTQFDWTLVVSSQVGDLLESFGIGTSTQLRVLPRQGSTFERIRSSRDALRDAAAEGDPDLVYTVFGPSYWSTGKPHVVGFARGWMTAEGSPATARLTAWQRVSTWARNAAQWRFFRNATCLLAETDLVRRKIQASGYLPGVEIKIVPNTYSLAFLEAVEAAPVEVRAAPRQDEGAVVFVPGAGYRHKNLDIVPRVAAELAKVTDRKVDFVLTLPETSQWWTEVRSEAVRLGVAQAVRTVGEVEHPKMAHHYLSSNMTFLPSLLESSTAVFPETFLAERPLVACDLDFTHELAANAAQVFRPLDAKSAARAIAEVLQDDALRARLVRRGLERIGETYLHPDQRWVRLKEVLSSVLECARGGPVGSPLER